MRRTLRLWSMRLLAVILTLAGTHVAVARILNESGLGQPVQAAVPDRPAKPESDGWLEARLALLPLDDPGRFDLTVTDGTGHLLAEASDLGNGGTTGAHSVAPGAYGVAVAGHDGTALGPYITTIECREDAGRGPVVASCAHCTALDGIPVASGAAVVCTVTQVNAQPPLAVAVAQFEAMCQGATPLLSWATEQEVNLQGFNLYRSASPAQPDTQLNIDLIPAAAPGSMQGAAYRWMDLSAAATGPHSYWLEVISLDGASSLLPPVTVICLAPTAVRLAQLEAATPVTASVDRLGAALALLALPVALLLWRQRRPV